MQPFIHLYFVFIYFCTQYTPIHLATMYMNCISSNPLLYLSICYFGAQYSCIYSCIPSIALYHWEHDKWSFPSKQTRPSNIRQTQVSLDTIIIICHNTFISIQVHKTAPSPCINIRRIPGALCWIDSIPLGTVMAFFPEALLDRTLLRIGLPLRQAIATHSPRIHGVLR